MGQPTDFSTPRLLIVDDDPIGRSLVSRTLVNAGFAVDEVPSGEDALATLAQVSFDLVLLDVMMDGIDGYETCRRLRMLPRAAHVPVVMFTGQGDARAVELAYDAGATDFINKPVPLGLLPHRVRYLLRSARTAEAARRGEERMARAQSLAQMGSWEIQADGTLRCSAELATIFGAESASPACATEGDFLARVVANDRERIRGLRAAAMAGAPYQAGYTIERMDGTRRSVFEHCIPVRDVAGQQIGVEGITQDVTERTEAQRKIRQLAWFDRTTGLPNAEFGLGLMAQTLQSPDRPLYGAVLHVDIDGFQAVNDALGRDAGDDVLRVASQRLKSRLHSAGAARSAQADVVARVGSNAFALYVRDVAGIGGVQALADAVREAMAAPIPLSGRDIALTASIGIAQAGRDGTDASALMQAAEQAYRVARKSGRNQIGHFTDALNREASTRLHREARLRSAIAGGELRVHLQPKVDAQSGRAVGAEALVRWLDPERGLVMPGDFIPLAEETGLIGPLTDWLLEDVCREIRRWTHAGHAPVPVSVNLAAPTFHEADLRARLDDLVARHGLQPQALVLEMTESLMMSHADDCLDILRTLRDGGYGLSLDDFGTGYSSLSYLSRMPITELKIDRAFVRGIQALGRDAALVAGVIDLARRLGLHIVAEGVETQAQVDWLLAHQCRILQGYHFARPMPTAEFERLLVPAATALRP
jgi:diguanylate cyclase (GGDEF)-like protein